MPATITYGTGSTERPVAVLTGATRGIGLSSARKLCEAGYHCVVSSRQEGNVKAAVKELNAAGYSASGRVCHAADGDGRRALLEHALSYGPVRALVLCAGTSPAPPAQVSADVSEKHMEKMWEVNVKAILGMVRDVRAANALADDAVVIVIGSIAGYGTLPGFGVYSMSKTAVHAVVRILAEEMAPVRVVGVAPGIIRTEFSRPLWERPEDEQRLRKWVPLGRVGEPDDIGAVVAFLCSKGASYLTGETIPVAGGMRSRL